MEITQLRQGSAAFFAGLLLGLCFSFGGNQYARHDDARLIQYVNGYREQCLRNGIGWREQHTDHESTEKNVCAAFGQTFRRDKTRPHKQDRGHRYFECHAEGKK